MKSTQGGFKISAKSAWRHTLCVSRMVWILRTSCPDSIASVTYWHCLWKGQAGGPPRVENKISRSSCESVVRPVSVTILTLVEIQRGDSRYKKPSKCAVRWFQDWVVQVFEITCKDTCGPPMSKYLVWTWYSLMIPFWECPRASPCLWSPATCLVAHWTLGSLSF